MRQGFSDLLSHEVVCSTIRVALDLGKTKRVRPQSFAIFLPRRRPTCGLGVLALVPMLAWSQGTYATNFPLAENPISEGGRWINGAATGLWWSNVQTSGGVASGIVRPDRNYNDPIAILTGTWGPVQTVQATVYSVNPTDSTYNELELHLHFALAANVAQGYEITYRVDADITNGFVSLVRWNGPPGNFSYLGSTCHYPTVCGQVNGIGVVNGNVVKATIDARGLIRAYISTDGGATFSLVAQAMDTTFTGGNPGMGMDGPAGTNTNWGFSSFMATDGSPSPSFTVSMTPASQTVAPGTNTVYTITMTPSSGFTGVASLIASGLPAGATANFNPSSITTAGMSTLTVTTPSSTPAGSYPLTITGTSARLSQTATATLVVSSSTGFSACDINKDGLVNAIDVQMAAANAASCSTAAFQTFYSQVITGLSGSCPVSTGLHTASLSWAARATSGITYNVYRATTSGGYNYNTPLNAAPIAGTSFSDCNVTLGQLYYYVVTAVNGSGQSANSNETSVTIPSN
jgi:hypothetical protein